MGGMGNQMFQYAFGRKLALLNNSEVLLDLSFLKRRDMNKDFVYRHYDLDIFNIYEKFLDIEKIKYMHVSYYDTLYNNYLSNLVIDSKENYLLEGYWQSVYYFEDIIDIIKKDFTFKKGIERESTKELLKEIQNNNSVMINIRRTDYLNTDFHGVLGLNYINSAIEIIKNRVIDAKYFIFSDDMEWCKNNIKIDNCIFVDHIHAGKKFEDYLQLMIQCKNFIISNSTFAWWSAFLSDNTNKVVVCPSKWFTNTPNSIITKNLNWIEV
jgi:hypothetical protein